MIEAQFGDSEGSESVRIDQGTVQLPCLHESFAMRTLQSAFNVDFR